MGMNLAAMRDRRIGDYWLRDAGQKHGGGASYRLDKVDVAEEGDPEKDSPDYTDSPEPHAWSGETGETGESFPARAPTESDNNKTCNCPIPEHYEEGESTPGQCPECSASLWCRACGGCIRCNLSNGA